jgi:zinc protease
MRDGLLWALSLTIGLLGMCMVTRSAAAQAVQGRYKKLATVEGITEYEFDNGLKVLLLPDPSRPKVTVNMTVLVGSRHEGYGESGMAHLLEHMVFKGTPTFPDIPKALKDHGAEYNGTTWFDRTNYFETMPASDENLEFGIKLEADRLVNSYVKREDLLKEFTVVRSEFERGEDSATRVLLQRMMAVAFEWHNYGKSTIGNRSDIERVPIENLQAFYKKYYQPDNVVLVVAGAFDEQKALRYISKYFGSIPRPTRVLDKTYTEEPPQDGERFVSVRRVNSVGAVGAIYHVPAGAHPDFPAVEILANILSDEPSGRLYKALVETKKASSVFATTFSLHDPGVLWVNLETEADKLDAAREAMIQTLEGLAQAQITEEEVARAKQQFLKRHEELMTRPDRVATELSEWVSKGDWRLFFIHRDRMEKVTADDVNRVAQQYLTRNNRTVGVYYPEKEAQRAVVAQVEPGQIDKLVKDYKGREAVVRGEAFDPTPANIESRTQRDSIEGVKLILLPKKTTGETVNLQLNLRFGNLDSLKNQQSAARLLGDMLERGTTKRDRQQLRDAIDKLGGKLSVSSSPGLVSVSLSAKRKTLPEMLDILAEILRSPAFPKKELELLRREQLEQIEKQRTEPTALAPLTVARKLNPYPKGDPRYVPTIDEEIAGLRAVSVADIRALYQQLGAIGELAVVGDFDIDTTRKAFKQMLTGWKGNQPYEWIERVANVEVKGELSKINTPDKANAMYFAGLSIAMTDSDPDYPALALANYILGGGTLSSRLGNRVRQKEGLSYGVASVFTADPKNKASGFRIYAISNPKNIDRVHEVIGEELKLFMDKGISSEELAAAQRGFLEQAKVARTRDDALARALATNEFAGRTYTHQAKLERAISELTPEVVTQTFRRYINPQRLVIVEAGDFGSSK